MAVSDIKVTELIVFGIVFGAVTVMGFMASKWRRGHTMHDLDEWGLGGRRFGSWVTWFLVGGNLYTAYTFVAVPALIFGAGAMGFFALPFTIIAYPLVMLPLLRLWSVSRVHGYVTTADFVRGRYGSPTLALLVAITGIVATMPYIALQLVGLEVVFRTMGLNTQGWLGHAPLFIAFFILALYTYQSGLRAPALIAFVKDGLTFLVIFVAVLYLPIKLDGWTGIFDAAEAKFAESASQTDGLLLAFDDQLHYATLALGSALAVFLYPHAVTGMLAANNRGVIRRNMSALPAFSLVLGLIALLGFAAIAAGVRPLINNATGRPDPNTVIPMLFDQHFPDWFSGLAFAAIGVGALVPAAIMSIAAANLWTRNIYKEYLHRSATPAQEANQAKLASLVVKFGAVVFIVGFDPQYAIDLQLIGGVIIMQTLPALVIPLYTRWFHIKGLITGWALGMAVGIWMLYQIPNATIKREHFGGVAYPIQNLGVFGWRPFADSGMEIYVGVVALAVNLVVAAAVTTLMYRLRQPNGTDATNRGDYFADEGYRKPKPIAAIATSSTRLGALPRGR
jgi:solute:Na+ symporter, SSS family